MNPQEQITKLQGLLARIQRNAAKPRAAMAFAAPAAAPAAPPAAVDRSVDDLLSAAPAASPIPVEVEVALDTLPPVAATAPASEAPEAEPIPLVSVAAATPEQAPQPPPAEAEPAAPEPPAPAATADEVFALESEVSEVRVAMLSREPAVEVTVAAIEAEAEPLGTEELSDEDLVEVEVTDLTSAPPAASDVDIDFEDEDEEQPPASSQRKVASTMDEALAAAAAQLDVEREVPIKTPPPESGPQEAPPPAGALAAPPAPDVDALLGQELDIPTRESGSAIAVAPAVGPTPEQLGQTIDLDEARGPSLELAEPPAAEAAPATVEELEVPLPGREPVGGYDDQLRPPPEAREDLDAHRRRLDEDVAPPPESLAQLPSVQPPSVEVVSPPAALADAAPLTAEVTSRPVPFGSPETYASVREPLRPSTFSELLDASLALNGD